VQADANAPVFATGEIEMAADPETVWAVMADIGSWPDWNPDITEATVHGPMQTGTTFDWKSGPGHHIDHGVDQAAAIAGNLDPAGRDQVVGWHAILGQEAMHVRGRRVAGPTRVNHNHRAPGPCQHQGHTQAGRAATNHHDVVVPHGPPG